MPQIFVTEGGILWGGGGLNLYPIRLISTWEKNSNSTFQIKVNLPDVQQKTFVLFSNIPIL